ncbi:MAG: hypothetical protein JNM94_11915 [Phycisphaerae bacterium]|nr:hypothetical protein [Phycisphaerae bacterium]
MSIVTRECPRCEQLLDSSSLACPECGMAVPADLRVVRGTVNRGELRRLSLLTGVGGSVLMIYIFLLLMLAMLALLNRLGGRLNTIEQVGFILVLIALPGFLALLLVVRLPSRVRAIAGDRSLGRRTRWAWTDRRVWRDVATFPENGEDLDADATMTATWRGGVVRLSLTRRTGHVQADLWMAGTADDARAVQAALPAATAAS